MNAFGHDPHPGLSAASPLAHIVRGIRRRPRRILIYGEPGVGKSTFAASAPAPIFIQTEDGADHLGVDRFPVATSLHDVMNALSALITDAHPYQTVVIDSLDWLEKLAHQAVCEERRIASISDLGWGKGYAAAAARLRMVIEWLTALRDQRDMHWILIAHAETELFESPDQDPYHRWKPKLHKSAWPIFAEQSDDVLFACYRVFTKTVETNAGSKRKMTQAINQGDRILRTTDRGSQVGKNRASLPPELPLDWNAYWYEIESFFHAIDPPTFAPQSQLHAS